MIAILRKQASPAITGGKNEWDAASRERLGDRIGLFAIDIHVQNGEID